MNNSQSYRLHEGLGYRVSRMARVMERHFEQMLSQYELTRMHWCVLSSVGEENVETPSELAEHIGINRTATSRVLREMESKGLIVRQRAKQDRRSTRVQLTPKGQEILQNALPQAMQTTEYFKHKLEDAEYQQLLVLIDKLLLSEEGALPGL